MEVLPVLIDLPFQWASYWRHPLTTLLYCCIFVPAMAARIPDLRRLHIQSQDARVSGDLHRARDSGNCELIEWAAVSVAR